MTAADPYKVKHVEPVLQRCLGADFYTGTRRHHPLALSPTLRRSFLCPRRGAFDLNTRTRADRKALGRTKP